MSVQIRRSDLKKAISERYDFILLFDVENGNPNGDPDAGNMPRIDPETGLGLVTDVCIKRKIRNYVEISKGNAAPFEIYIREKAVLNELHELAYKRLGAVAAEPGTKRRGKWEEVEKARAYMCENFYDVRTFGAVMSTGINCGQVRGPVQINFARSIDPITPIEISITRMAVATREEAEKQSGDNRTMGRKYIVPYGLYRAEGHISAHLADQTGFCEEDKELLWEALSNMFDHDHSAAKGKMITRRLVAFKHGTRLGNAPAHQLFDLMTVKRGKNSSNPPRSFNDYEVDVDTRNLKKNITIINLV